MAPVHQQSEKPKYDCRQTYVETTTETVFALDGRNQLGIEQKISLIGLFPKIICHKKAIYDKYEIYVSYLFNLFLNGNVVVKRNNVASGIKPAYIYL